MRSSSIRRLRSGLIAWRRESSFAATARPSCTNTGRSRLFLHWPLPEALSAIRPDAMTVPALAAAGSPC